MASAASAARRRVSPSTTVSAAGVTATALTACATVTAAVPDTPPAVETLSQRDWDRFIQARRAGRAGRSGQPVGNRTIAWDLTFLMTVLNWAARSRDEDGNLLLDSNPLKGLRKPREKNPNRVVLTEDEYRALLGVSRQVGWRFHVALVLVHETGHRIGAIRKLTWSDIDFEGKTIRWRAEHEKTGYEHITPLTAEALAWKKREGWARGTGNGPVLWSSRDATKCTRSDCIPAPEI